MGEVASFAVSLVFVTSFVEVSYKFRTSFAFSLCAAHIPGPNPSFSRTRHVATHTRRTRANNVADNKKPRQAFDRPAIRPSIHPPVCQAVWPSDRPNIDPPVRQTGRATVRPHVTSTVRPAVRQAGRPTNRPSIRPTDRQIGRPTVRPAVRQTDRLSDRTSPCASV